mmetsp:Transcript_55451/g.161949  ORF Transcript_55451/g.161949 Transcript_55451/m.161949 type:complete len:306 (-) Transcript_55451:1135-2052(-)
MSSSAAGGGSSGTDGAACAAAGGAASNSVGLAWSSGTTRPALDSWTAGAASTLSSGAFGRIAPSCLVSGATGMIAVLVSGGGGADRDTEAGMVACSSSAGGLDGSPGGGPAGCSVGASTVASLSTSAGTGPGAAASSTEGAVEGLAATGCSDFSESCLPVVSSGLACSRAATETTLASKPGDAESVVGGVTVGSSGFSGGSAPETGSLTVSTGPVAGAFGSCTAAASTATTVGAPPICVASVVVGLVPALVAPGTDEGGARVASVDARGASGTGAELEELEPPASLLPAAPLPLVPFPFGAFIRA